MTETKFTPGPWYSDIDEDGEVAVLKDGYFVTYAFPAECGAGGDTKCNAHLIAAAPDLYEALSDFAEYENLMEDGDDIAAMLKYGDASRKARAALAKARGE